MLDKAVSVLTTYFVCTQDISPNASPMIIIIFFMDCCVSPNATANEPADLGPAGPSARADCSRARISAQGNHFHPLVQLSGVVPEAHSDSGTSFYDLRYYMASKEMCQQVFSVLFSLSGILLARRGPKQKVGNDGLCI